MHHLIARISRRLASEDGFTIVELLVATVIGILVILAADTLLDTSLTLTGRADNRVDSSERARFAMAQMTRELRSQVCFQDSSGDPGPSILQTPQGVTSPQTGDYAVTFYEYLGSATNPSTYAPQEVTLAWNNSNNTITETDYQGTGTPPNVTFPTTPTKTSTIVTNVVPEQNSLNQSLPVFSYYQYSGSNLSTTPLATPLSASDAANVAAVEVRFVARANHRSDGQQATTLDEQALIPGWDPNSQSGPSPPPCL